MAIYKIKIVKDANEGLEEALADLKGKEVELKYDDLGAEIDEGDRQGIINDWTYYMELPSNANSLLDLIGTYLDKKNEEITPADIKEKVYDGKELNDEFIDFLAEEYIDDAVEDAQNDYSENDVEWNENEEDEEGIDEEWQDPEDGEWHHHLY